MLPQKLDLLFPYLCFAYGFLMTVALNIPALAEIADERFPHHVVQQWRAHRGLALFCLVVGGLWILQNLWLV